MGVAAVKHSSLSSSAAPENPRGLMLKTGVVIRGQAPEEKDFATDGKLGLPTKFIFGFQKKGIGERTRADGTFEKLGGDARDNWVYNHGHKGFNVSGSWVTIRNNHNERDYLKGGDDVYGLGGDWILTLDGNSRANAGGNGSISDNLSRAFDLSGKNLWVDGNFFNNVGSDPGNDGEGILCQKHGGTDLYSWAVTRNKHERGSGEKSYIGGWDVKVFGCLLAWNQTSGWVGQTKVSLSDSVDEAYVGNQAEKVNVAKNSATMIECPPTAPAAPRDVKAEIYGSDAVKISWSDASDTEIGFRVERSFDGKTWTALPGKTLRYRVAAINCDDNAAGASAPTPDLALRLP